VNGPLVSHSYVWGRKGEKLYPILDPQSGRLATERAKGGTRAGCHFRNGGADLCKWGEKGCSDGGLDRLEKDLLNKTPKRKNGRVVERLSPMAAWVCDFTNQMGGGGKLLCSGFLFVG